MIQRGRAKVLRTNDRARAEHQAHQDKRHHIKNALRARVQGIKQNSRQQQSQQTHHKNPHIEQMHAIQQHRVHQNHNINGQKQIATTPSHQPNTATNAQTTQQIKQ